MDKAHTLYNEAIKAGDAFEQAIKDQFGPRGDWWSVPITDYNKKTYEAYKSKLVADKAWIETYGF
jgi:hypothetical protein